MIRVLHIVCLTALFAGAASAQPHAETEVDFTSAEPVTEPAAMGEMLQRLAGKFRFTGIVQAGDCGGLPGVSSTPPPPDNCRTVKGHAECIRIAEGSGVHCILNVTWIDIFPGLMSYLDPAMLLAGLNPGKAAAEYMIVNNKGVPEGGPGTFKGDVISFKSPCPFEIPGCYHMNRIEARPDARSLTWWLIEKPYQDGPKTWGVLTLLRLTDDEAEEEFAGTEE